MIETLARASCLSAESITTLPHPHCLSKRIGRIGAQGVIRTGTRSSPSFDDAIGACLNLRRNSNTEVLGCFGVDE